MKKLIFFALMTMFSFGLYAQDETIVEIQNRKGPYVTNSFGENWFVTVGGGAQVYWGMNDFKDGFWRQVKPAVDVAVGKWFLPTIGARLEWSGIKASSWGKGLNPYTDDDNASRSSKNNYYAQKFNSSILHFDMMWNLSNSLGGYRPDRFWNVIPYLGVGWAHSWDSDYHNNQVAANLGILHNFYVCPIVSIQLDLRGTAFGRRYDLYDNPRAFDYLTTATLGLTFNINNKSFKRASDLVVVNDNTGFINEINNLKEMLADVNAERDRYKNDLNAARNKKHVVETDPIVGNFAIFFRINSAKISEQGMINLGYAADAIRQTDKKYILYASADKETGSEEYNQQLSQKRGEAVKRALVDTFGVNPDQLEIRAVGSSEQKFKGIQNNRVVIVESNPDAKTADMNECASE